MKKNKLIMTMLFSLLLFLTGCNSNVVDNRTTTSVSKSEISGLSHITCKREGEADNVVAKMKYDLYSDGDYIQVLKSEESVTSDKAGVLDEYQKAYENVFSAYKDLDYYNVDIKRDDKSVSVNIKINYDKVDTDKLIEIENVEDNMIKNGKLKLSDWKDYVKNIGVTCE